MFLFTIYRLSCGMNSTKAIYFRGGINGFVEGTGKLTKVNHVFVVCAFLLWFQLDDSCSCDEGECSSYSPCWLLLCVGAGQTAQSAVKARVAVSSGDTTTGKAGWHCNQVMQVEDYRNSCLSDVNDMQLNGASPQMNSLFGTWKLDFLSPQYVKQWILWRVLRS